MRRGLDDAANIFERIWYDADLRAALVGFAYLLGGGIAGYYIRFLYRHYARTVSNRESFSAIFPALTLATVLVILVVKASLALSLGLVGALSIVRFRAAIKEPEEIVYLFFCIAVGLALGAEYPTMAILGLIVFTGFVLVSHRLLGRAPEGALLLSVSGRPTEEHRRSTEALTQTVRDVVGSFVVQRLDVDDEELHFRAVISLGEENDVGASMGRLRERLEGYRISYVSLENLL